MPGAIRVTAGITLFLELSHDHCEYRLDRCFDDGATNAEFFERPPSSRWRRPKELFDPEFELKLVEQLDAGQLALLASERDSGFFVFFLFVVVFAQQSVGLFDESEPDSDEHRRLKDIR